MVGIQALIVVYATISVPLSVCVPVTPKTHDCQRPTVKIDEGEDMTN